jgi:tetratricopeptide (TPR) repeat protein
VFAHERDVAGKTAVDFGARYFHARDEMAPQGVPALLASAKAIRNVASALQPRGRLELLRPLVTLGLGHARSARDAAPQLPDGWKLLGQLEELREPMASPDPIPRFRMAFDPVFDLPFVRAAYCLREALERAPSDFLSLMLLARLDERRGMDETALPLIERLLTIAPTNVMQTQVQRDLKTEVSALRARLGPAPVAPVPANRNEHDRLLASLLAAGRPASAASLLERDYPPQARSWEQADRLATLHLHMGQPARARATWEAATAPRPALRLARIAVTHFVEGHFDTARHDYNEALAVEPGLFEALYGLAVLEQDAGHAPAALAAAREAQAHAAGDVAQSAAHTIAAWVAPYAAQDKAVPRAGSTAP